MLYTKQLFLCIPFENEGSVYMYNETTQCAVIWGKNLLGHNNTFPLITSRAYNKQKCVKMGLKGWGEMGSLNKQLISE